MTTFSLAFRSQTLQIEDKFLSAPLVHSETWQSIKAPQPMAELLHQSLSFPLAGESLDIYRKVLSPNLPWADEHFELDRVSGFPLNPGKTWRQWPWSAAADLHRRPGEEDPQFDHSYAERYWPKFAGGTPDDTPRQGYRFPYGDLNDLVEVLAEAPLTRQGFLPVWFPEDLGACREHKRVPCTLGYHFIRRFGKLHVTYYMRSCDFVRHFNDDVYLTIRLLLWVLAQLRFKSRGWDEVTPGTFTMHITSLHMFAQDRKALLEKHLGAKDD